LPSWLRPLGGTLSVRYARMGNGRQHYIFKNGTGWCWENVENDRRILARGMTDTYAAAIAQAAAADQEIERERSAK
jgi:hypothetical protein